MTRTNIIGGTYVGATTDIVCSMSEWIRSMAQKRLNHADEVTGEIKPLRQHLWIRGLPQMIDVGSLLSVDESSTQVVRGAVKAYTDGGAAHPADPRTRRSGWGIWVEEGHPLNSHGV
eukprot:181862-Heterocapsa_arctica.AAC.1